MIVGIDASNLRRGGGLTHLIEILRYGDPMNSGISRIVVYGSSSTIALIEKRSWLHLRREGLLDKSLLFRQLWQRFVLPKQLKRDAVEILFVPGGSDGSGFHPFVTMSRNMLPFEWNELRRHGWTFSTLRYLLLRWAHGRSFRKADGVVFLTEYAKAVTLKHLGELKGVVTRIPHGVDDRFFRPPKAQRTKDEITTEHPFRLLYVSIVDPYKHQWHVVRAVGRLRRDGLNVALDLVGPAGSSESMRRLRDAMDEIDPTREFVRYLGPVAYSELHDSYCRADAFVFASSCENMPNILLESMASGLPIVCSKRGPMPEILRDAGLYFDPEDEGEIAQAIARIYSSPDLRAQLANAAFLLASQYSWKRCADQTFSNIAFVASNFMRFGHPDRYRYRKVIRFALIYGVTRTAFKVMGRLRISFALPLYKSRHRDIGIVGCGQYAFSTIGHGLWRRYGNRISVAYDIDAAVQQQFERSYSVRSSAKSFADVLAVDGLKIVYIASNHASHAEYAVSSILAGKITYVEKPVATTYLQLVMIAKALERQPVAIFAGYNRPFSQAILDLRSALKIKSSEGISLQCFISGHSLPPSHWYRKPEEGTRICGNVGHWLDLAVHIFYWRKLPDKLKISLTIADESAPDDDLVIAFSSDLGDVVSIMITSRCEPFEGINETINFQHHNTIAKIDDFRTMNLWQGPKLVRKKYWPKDAGHRTAVLQPFIESPKRDWKEVEATSLLMLHITEMVRNRVLSSTFSFDSSLEQFRSDVDAYDFVAN